MALSKEETRPASALATVLRQRKDALVEAWTHRVLDDPDIPRANTLDRPLLADHVPHLIDELVAALDAPSPDRRGEEGGHAIGSDEKAVAHARLRFNLGYSTPAALRELVHFRAEVINLLYREGTPVRLEEVQLLHASIDTVMETVAAEFTRGAQMGHHEQIAFRDRFMDILSHDMRNPLGSIMFNAAALQRDQHCTQQQSKALGRIVASADRMSRMISDLLDLTRTREGGSLPVDPAPSDLHEICRHAIEELEGYRPSTPIELETQGSGAGTWDPDRIAQIVSNLVSNAIDYSPPGAPVRVSVREEGRDHLLEVHNEGRPIPPEALKTLFDPFRQGGQAGRQSGRRGLGLGLFICREIAIAHGGSIDVETDAEHGTTFTVRLPKR